MTEKQIKEVTIVFEDDCPITISLKDIELIDIICDKESYYLFTHNVVDEYWKSRFRILKRVCNFRIKLICAPPYRRIFITNKKYSMINSLRVVYEDEDADDFIMPWFGINSWGNVNQDVIIDNDMIVIKINDKRTIKKYIQYCWSYAKHVIENKTFYRW